ncbi:MAG: hypothetical protein WCA79_18700 [Anaerolineales bacterium]
MDIVTTIQNTNTLVDLGSQANEAAARVVFSLYQERRLSWLLRSSAEIFEAKQHEAIDNLVLCTI